MDDFSFIRQDPRCADFYEIRTFQALWKVGKSEQLVELNIKIFDHGRDRETGRFTSQASLDGGEYKYFGSGHTVKEAIDGLKRWQIEQVSSEHQ